MADDVLINKAATIERCVARAREEYEKGPDSFIEDHTRQDAAILNIQRACEAALDMGQHLIRREGLGVPQSSRDVFALLGKARWIDTQLITPLQNMVGFRNIAVHDYQTLQLPIVVSVITRHLSDFTEYSQQLLLKDARDDRSV
ncbi:type VII toxin-antitoxin system HepT family RNase toxin [Halopseudomonas sp.]|uniref:type VII toxin-antitoxin system HepT family RNase toxin n=1 Tax=Halopseudomonas sp. TaxID=2901191 RepID=UPI003002BE0A